MRSPAGAVAGQRPPRSSGRGRPRAQDGVRTLPVAAGMSVAERGLLFHRDMDGNGHGVLYRLKTKGPGQTAQSLISSLRSPEVEPVFPKTVEIRIDLPGARALSRYA